MPSEADKEKEKDRENAMENNKSPKKENKSDGKNDSGPNYRISLFPATPGDPSRAPLPRVNNLLAPAAAAVPGQATLGSVPKNVVRNKVALKPGRSLIDWMRLGKSGKDLTGVNGKISEITSAQLSSHNKETDAWIALNGKVYNVTPYMEFHPGGIPEMMRGVGKDGTKLFEEVHKWVNYESMLAKCFVGTLKLSISRSTTPSKNKDVKQIEDDFASFPDNKEKPWYEWSEDETSLIISIHSDRNEIRKEDVIVDKINKSLHIRTIVGDRVYHVERELEENLTDKLQVNLDDCSGKVEIVLEKEEKGKKWLKFGKAGPADNQWMKFSDEDIAYRICKVASVTNVTHDTKLYCIEYPSGTHMIVPVGCHVFLSLQVEGVEVIRPYTVVSPFLVKREEEEMDYEERVLSGQVFYLMIKTYKDGLLTPSIDSLQPGDKIQVSSLYSGNFNESSLKSVSRLVMFAAGTGFTPMASLIRHIFKQKSNPISSTQLVFFNKQESDILWKSELDLLSSSNHDRFNVHYVLSNASSEWKGLRGRVDKELIERLSPFPTEIDKKKILFCVCGPTQFTDKVIRCANEVGYSDDIIHAFTS